MHSICLNDISRRDERTKETISPFNVDFFSSKESPSFWRAHGQGVRRFEKPSSPFLPHGLSFSLSLSVDSVDLR